MKKLAAVFLCLAMLFSFIGCNNTQMRNEEARECLKRVLEKEQSFTYKCLVFDKVTDENLQKFNFKTEDSALNLFIPQGYTYIDFDSDGIEELLIADATLKYFLILRHDNEKVNGYIIENISLQDIKTDGTFLTVGYSYSSINRVSFKDLDYEKFNLAYKNDSTSTYQINQESSAMEEVEKYFNNWNENTTKISWMTIE